MRRLLFVLAIAGCTHAATTGPQWPKSEVSDDDGGESIAPREGAKSVVAATETDDDEDATPAQDATPAADSTPAAASDDDSTPAAAAGSDDVIQTDEIVIEVGPDD
jgi:hypothetical protein